MRKSSFEKRIAVAFISTLDWLTSVGDEYPRAKNTKEIVEKTGLLLDSAIDNPNLPAHQYTSELNLIIQGINAIVDNKPQLNQVQSNLPAHGFTSIETYDLQQKEPVPLDFELMYTGTVHRRVDLEPVGINIISKSSNPGAVLSNITVLSLPTIIANSKPQIKILLQDLLKFENVIDISDKKDGFLVSGKGGTRYFYDLGRDGVGNRLFFSKKTKVFQPRNPKSKKTQDLPSFALEPNLI